MQFVIFHGSFGSPEGNWFPELKEKLEALGQKVFVPYFPTEDWEKITKAGPKIAPAKQTLANWLATFKNVSKQLDKSEPLCFIGHSLGGLFILHVVDKYNLSLDSAIFVGPFLSSLNKLWQFKHVNGSFYKRTFDFQKLRRLIPVSYVLYSDNDPYVEKNLSIDFGKRLNSSLLLIKRAGHMNLEVNLNEFPLVFELCKTRLDLSLYQKYMAHRKELYAVDYISPHSEEVVYLEPKEVFDEGIFKFRNLRKSGFCTFLTSLRFWDTQAVYYQQARLAAKRVTDFSRVFVIDKISDLGRKKLLEHIKLDIESGMRVYLCSAAEVKKITPEPDFGIWDEDYLCLVHYDQGQQVEVKLSSRRKDIEEALRWKKAILKIARRIQNTGRDIADFIKKQESL